MPENSANTDSPRTLRTSTTTLNVINALKSLNGATVTKMADHLELSKGGVYNHLATLRENDFVIKNGEEYDLSPRFILIGEHVRQERILYQFGKQELDKIVEETGEYAQLITERHGLGIVLYLRRGEKAIGSNYPDQMERKPINLHHLAAGKAILDRLPDERVEEIVDQHGLRKRTGNTITDKEKLFEELAEVNERGYAYNIEEEVDGLRAVGAAIDGPDGNVLGAISLSGPKSRMQGERFEEELPKKVMNTADVIEVNINMDTRSEEF
ncbi:IclR family transcriptional regulator [Halorientalis salina]|uniref:IclR family transcriptional regulator n=1 Tax=Halorientalis salina TaxID=2932266 RepID=UPI0010AB74BF|nr:IclR family transcriptional regulator [Halorientalis salina]